MQLSLYNTLTRKKEIFQPLNSNLVKMYVCGPTVYDRPHIGNARSVVVYDILYRLLNKIFGQNKVCYVRNITDVDDKIIFRAKELNITIKELTDKTTTEFHSDMNYLFCLPPTIEPKATLHIDDMIMIIEKLLSTNHAYIMDHHVYFNISTSDDYTKLSKRNLSEMLEGVRVENSESKKHPHDFVLWKPAIATDDYIWNFDSPWGRGRPGWHIECSAMSYKYLGTDFDIHGGGADLIFPHHTNEIAQSRCAFPNSSFAQYWVHNGFLTCDGDKMSKSLGNFITVKDLIDKNIKGEVVRLFLLSSHYRKPLDYNNKALEDSTKMLDYWYRTIENTSIIHSSDLPDDFLLALFDDINTPLAIKIINDYAKLSFTALSVEEKNIEAAKVLACANFLGLMNQSAFQWFQAEIDTDYVSQLIQQRNKAKSDKQWILADQIRAHLLQQGIMLEDRADGTTVAIKAK